MLVILKAAYVWKGEKENSQLLTATAELARPGTNSAVPSVHASQHKMQNRDIPVNMVMVIPNTNILPNPKM